MNKYELINKDSSYSGMYRVKVFENEGNIRVYIPGISQINPFDSNGNLIEDIVNQNISAFPIAQWCAYNLESCDLANISEPMWCMFEGGDVKRPVIISYTFPKVVIEVTVYVGGSEGGVSDSDGTSGGEYTGSEEFSEKFNFIYNKLIEAGASHSGAIALLGMLCEETNNFNTSTPNSIGATGICQWYKGRLDILINGGTLNGQTWNKPADYTDLSTQVDYLIFELKNNGHGNQSKINWDSFTKNYSSESELKNLYFNAVRYYEIPFTEHSMESLYANGLKEKNSGNVNGKWAIYKNVSDKMDLMLEWYDKYN